MNANDLLESESEIKANPLLPSLRMGNRLYIFLWVTMLALNAFLLIQSIFFTHDQFITKIPVPPFMFPMVPLVVPSLMGISQWRYWKRIEPRRFAAARGEHSLLATEQPWPSEAPTLLSPSIELRRSKEFFLLISAMALIIALIYSGVLAFELGISIFSANPFLNFLASFLTCSLPLLGFIFALRFSSFGKQEVTVTEGGLIAYDGHQTHAVMWQEARLFARYNALGAEKNGAAIAYELSSARDIVRWTWVLRKTYWVGMEPTISYNEYNWQMQALLSFVTARTGLLLYDLRKDKPGGVKD